MPNNKTLCCTCNKPKITYSCKGCLQEFCSTHLSAHRETLNEELNLIIDDYNQFKQMLSEQVRKYSILKLIDQCEMNSTATAPKIAGNYASFLEDQQIFLNYFQEKSNCLIKQIEEIREEDEFNEMNLNYLKDELRKMTEECNNSVNRPLEQYSCSYLTRKSAKSSTETKFSKWKQNGEIIAGGEKPGRGLTQLNFPCSICIDKDSTAYIADSWNHRIVQWKLNEKEGKVVTNGYEKENFMCKLSTPTDVIVDGRDGSLIIADCDNRRIVRWFHKTIEILMTQVDCHCLAQDRSGLLYACNRAKNEVMRWEIGNEDSRTIVSGGNGQGSALNQLSQPARIFVDDEQSIYVSDVGNHRVMKWRKGASQGTIVAGGNHKGKNLNQLNHPAGLTVDSLGRIYVADFGNNRIVRWCEGSKEGEIVISENSKELCCPRSLAFDSDGNLFVVNWGNSRVLKFLPIGGE
ncbi:unnamed protein product [Adineta ricciae]|uniref:Uncharacterized protein n=1 Tax=Adineta ricciae TaxID=249248 RepID=A0A814JXX0_ADIRI|nr:unnamed protein product [Adineta ricciae]CAF1355029.1 unnamed protein product [Adineta ricciae]